MGSAVPRFAYCKAGDAVSELETLGPAPARVPAAGPQHYIASFLTLVRDRPTLLLSVSATDAALQRGAVAARAMRYQRSAARPLVSAWTQWRAFALLLAELRRFRPTLILCAVAGGPPLWACHLHARRYGVPLICTRHTSMALRSRNPLRRLRRAVNAYVVRRSAAVMCHGPYLEDELGRLGVPPERLFQFNLAYGELLAGADFADAGSPQRREIGAAPMDADGPGGIAAGRGRRRGARDAEARTDDFVLLYVGRMRREKGVFDLYEAARPLLARHADLRLVYAGGGRDLDALAARIEADGADARATLLGPVEHARLPALYRDARVVVTPTHSSSTESRCKVAIEALVTGRPVVAPAFGPFPYTVEPERNGLLYQPDDVEDLRAKLERLLDDRRLLDALTRGAAESGRAYLATQVSFTDALKQAFGAAGKDGVAV